MLITTRCAIWFCLCRQMYRPGTFQHVPGLLQLLVLASVVSVDFGVRLWLKSVRSDGSQRSSRPMSLDTAGLMGADEEGTLAQLKIHRRALVDPKIKQHRGRIVKTTGDGTLVEFASVVEVVRCAVEVQQEIVKRNAEVLQEKRIEFHIGINVGDIIIDGNDIFGDGVNVAADLEAIAEPSGILISRQVYDQIEGKLALRFRRLGLRDLKNIAKPASCRRARSGRKRKAQCDDDIDAPWMGCR
jgi:hypothetical protein